MRKKVIDPIESFMKANITFNHVFEIAILILLGSAVIDYWLWIAHGYLVPSWVLSALFIGIAGVLFGVKMLLNYVVDRLLNRISDKMREVLESVSDQYEMSEGEMKDETETLST